MSTNTASIYPDCSTLANFQAWAQWISSFFAAAGWVQQADTGQVNWSTISSVPSSGAPAFEIWKSADSLSAASPITVKMEYGASGSTPWLAITVGTNGTNGTGTLNSPVSTRMVLQSYTPETTGTWPCYASGDAGSIRFIMFGPNGSSSYPYTYEYLYFGVSRSRDNSGNASGTYVQFVGGKVSYNYSQAVFNASIGGVTTQESYYLMSALPYTASSGSYGGNTMVSPVFVNVGGLSNPSPDFMLGKNTDFADGAGVSISTYGVAHNYITLNTNAQMCAACSCALLMRYE